MLRCRLYMDLRGSMIAWMGNVRAPGKVAILSATRVQHRRNGDLLPQVLAYSSCSHPGQLQSLHLRSSRVPADEGPNWIHSLSESILPHRSSRNLKTGS